MYIANTQTIMQTSLPMLVNLQNLTKTEVTLRDTLLKMDYFVYLTNLENYK